MKHLVAPSMLAADFANLQRDTEMINNSQADWFHLDIMDGIFVPNISFGIPVVEAIDRHARKPLDVHLMIEDPDRYLEAFHRAGADLLTIHVEACRHLHRSIQKIHSLGIKAGVSLNPHTPISALEAIIQDVDLVLIMSVNPGFGGQTFIPQSLEKIRRLSHMIRQSGSSALIEVDGGVTTANAAELVEMGANVLVAGSFVFTNQDPHATIQKLKQLKK